METGLYTFLVLLTLFLGMADGFVRRRWIGLGCVAGLLVLTRPDGWLVIAAVALESIGAGGWYSERYIVDEGGLVSSRVDALNRFTVESSR